MGVHEIDRGAAAVDDEVVAGVALVAGVLDGAAARGGQRRPAGGRDVLALVGVAGAGRAEAAGTEVEFMRPENRKGVAVEGEAEVERGRGGRLARGRGGGGRRLRADPEAVAAVARRPAFVRGPVPAHFARHVRRHVFPVEGLDDFASGVDDLDLEIVFGLGAADREGQLGIAVAEVEGLVRGRFGGDEGEGTGARRARGGSGWAAFGGRRCSRRGGAAGGRRRSRGAEGQQQDHERYSDITGHHRPDEASAAQPLALSFRRLRS